METKLILPTILVPQPYSHGNHLLYFATDQRIICEPTTAIWRQLTGRKTIRPNDLGLIADLTRGLVLIENPLQ
jgi:hypothetical protein